MNHAPCPADCDNCWPETDIFIESCTFLDNKTLECGLPSVKCGKFYTQINIDNQQYDYPVFWTESDATASITYYEPYNITEAVPSTVDRWVIVQCARQNAAFGNQSEATCNGLFVVYCS